MSVSIMPGLKPNSVTPLPRSSTASVRVNEVTQALVAAYRPVGELA